MTLHVDRLTLRLAGLSVAEGRKLAYLVGEGLASATSPAGVSQVDALRVTLDARAGEPLEGMAERIVAGILRNLGAAG